jgi:hypothetical protein
MIRTLVIVAAVSFVLAVGCLAGALAMAGGPFYFDHHLNYHPGALDVEYIAPPDLPAANPTNAV